MHHNVYCCPRCRNQEVYSLSIIYEMGRSRFESSGFTYEGEIGVFSGSGNISSLLSQRCAPPKKLSYLGILFLATICLVWGELLLKGLFFVILFLLTLLLLTIDTFTIYFLNLNLLQSGKDIIQIASDNIDNIAGFLPLKLLMLLLIAYYIYRVWYYRNRIWPKSYQSWRNSWICLRCNVIF